MHRTRQLVLTALLTLLLALAGIAAATTPAAADAIHSETVGGNANTWTDYTSAGGTQGQTIAAYATIQIACKLPGFRVADGNTWWYRIASAPWSYGFYVSADAFYNNGATSGSLAGTPFVDPAVPDCDSAVGIAETAGGAANTWTDYTSAGGTAGPQIASRATVRIACKLTGFRVADGNTWWYRVASAPWNNGFYVSADAFYNNGATSGSLVGTPWVDTAVPDCAGAPSAPAGSGSVTLARGAVAPAGYRYSISLTGFPANTSVLLTCFDSASTGGFYSFTLTTNSNGSAANASYCYSGDGPDHWVIALGRFVSNHVAWGTGTTAGSGSGVAGPAPSPTPPTVNPFYNRSAAVAWTTSHASDPQAYGAMCTWFASNALWAGGFPKTSTWTNAGNYGSAPGTKTAWWLPDFLPYIRSKASTTTIEITANLRTNAVPQAERGDLILYDWGNGDGISHVSFVHDIAPGQYPNVSEMGQYDFDVVHAVVNKIVHVRSDYTTRGWTWSQVHGVYLQQRYPRMRVYLLHINGGYYASGF